MSTQDEGRYDWSLHTVIDSDELEKHIFQTDNMGKNKLKIHNYCLTIDGGTVNKTDFINFLKDKFPYFVMSESEIKKQEWAYHTALERTDYKEDYITEGKLGELILFVILDGFFDMPLVCHKISLLQNVSDPQKGSDGIFYGEFQKDDSLALGEAKFFTNVSDAVSDAIESTYRFHGEEGQIMKKKELQLASNNLSENLEGSRLEEIADAISSDSEAWSTFRLIHPIFIGYESEDMHEILIQDKPDGELKREITEMVEEKDIMTEIEASLEDYPKLKEYILVFIFLPFTNIDDFKKDMHNTIFPQKESHK
jgi:hypothetical protein